MIPGLCVFSMPAEATLIEGGGLPERKGGSGEQTLIEGSTPATPGGGSGANLAAGGRYLDLQLVSALQVTSGEADLWLAKDGRGRSVVLKLYRYGVKPKAEVAKKLPRISREHVVEVYARGVGPDERHYEVLEHVRHGSLADLGRGGLAEAKVREVLRELTDAVGALHAESILHRDLKPSNVLVRSLKPLDLVLADFGISSVADVTLWATTVHRTAAYSAPEGMTGVVSKASDWWSIGVIILELLVGRHPYAGLDEKAINFALAMRAIPVPGDLPARWQMLLKGLLTRDHAKRWGLEQVRQWLGGAKDIPVYYEGERPDGKVVEHRHRPYKFSGTDYYEVGELAKALAQEWNEAVKHFGRRMITDWVSGQLSDQQLASVLMDIAEDEKLNGEQKLAVALVAMNVELPLTWRGEVVNREWLAANGSGAFEMLDSRVPDWLARLRKERLLKDLRKKRSEANAALKRYGLPFAEPTVADIVFAEDERVQELAAKVQQEYYSSTSKELSRLLSKSELEWAEAAVLALAPPSFFSVRRKQEAAECFKKFKQELAAPDIELISDLERHRQQIPEATVRVERRLQRVFGNRGVPKALAERVKAAASKAAEEAGGKIAGLIIERVERDLEVPESESISDLECHRQRIPDAVLKLEERLQKVFGDQPVPKPVVGRVEVLSGEALAKADKAIAARKAELAEQRLLKFEEKCVTSGRVPTSLQHLEGCRADIATSAEATELGLRELYGGENVPARLLARLGDAKHGALESIGALLAERATAERDVSAELPRRLAEEASSEGVTALRVRLEEIRGRFSDIDCSQLERAVAEVEVGRDLPQRWAQGPTSADLEAVQTRVEEIKSRFPDIDCGRLERSLAEWEVKEELPRRLADERLSSDFGRLQTRVETIKRRFPDIECGGLERALAQVEVSRVLPPQLAGDLGAVRARVEEIKRRFPEVDCSMLERSLAEREVKKELVRRLSEAGADGDVVQGVRRRFEEITGRFPDIQCSQLERSLAEWDAEVGLLQRLAQARLPGDVEEVKRRVEEIKGEFGRRVDCSQVERALALWEVREELPRRLEQSFQEVSVRLADLKRRFPEIDYSQLEKSVHEWESFCGGLEEGVKRLEQSLRNLPRVGLWRGLLTWIPFVKQKRAILDTVARLETDLAGRRAALDQPQYRGTRNHPKP